MAGACGRMLVSKRVALACELLISIRCAHSIEHERVRWPHNPTNGTWHGALNALSMAAYASAAGSVCGVVNDVGIAASPTTVVLVTNARDETHLYQWIAHHLLIGFAHILVFDDLSREPEASLAKLPASLRARVTILLRCPRVPWPKKTVLQQDGVNAAAILGAGWAMHLDADEYLTLRGGHGYGQQGASAPDTPSASTAGGSPLAAWLATLPADTSQVLLNWLMYGSGFREDVGPNEVRQPAVHRVHWCTAHNLIRGFEPPRRRSCSERTRTTRLASPASPRACSACTRIQAPARRMRAPSRCGSQ